MKHKTITRLIAILLSMFGLVFAVINYNGDDYTEKLMSLTQSGIGTYRFVVMGTGLTVSAGGNRDITTFTINGTDYKSSSNSAVTASGDDRYYIVYIGKKSAGTFTLNGTNDWTTQTNTTISLPFTQSGSGSNFYVTDAKVDSIVSANVDNILIINNADYTNQTVTTLPARINGNYYIYYGATAGTASLKVTPYTPILDIKIFFEGGL